nr:hypothetical protein Iba_chr06fCG6970 [Ipomoea batatas]
MRSDKSQQDDAKGQSMRMCFVVSSAAAHIEQILSQSTLRVRSISAVGRQEAHTCHMKEWIFGGTLTLQMMEAAFSFIYRKLTLAIKLRTKFIL